MSKFEMFEALWKTLVDKINMEANIFT